MIIVADTSPLNYLILINQIELLNKLYGAITIPEAVFRELQADKTPDKVKDWIKNHPDWISVQSISRSFDEQLTSLHRGEAEAITLAEELSAAGIIIDEKEGRRIAIERGLTVTGLLGVLRDASMRNLIDLTAALNDLEKTVFRVSPALIKELIRQDQKRKTSLEED